MADPESCRWWHRDERMARPSKFTPERKQQQIVLSVLRGELSVAEAGRRFAASETSISKWRDVFVEGGVAALKNGSRVAPSLDIPFQQLAVDSLQERLQAIELLERYRAACLPLVIGLNRMGRRNFVRSARDLVATPGRLRATSTAAPSGARPASARRSTSPCTSSSCGSGTDPSAPTAYNQSVTSRSPAPTLTGSA
jgi:transposase